MNNLKHLFNSKKKIFTFIIILVIAAVLPLTILLSQKQQEIRQRASTQSCLVDIAKCKWDPVSNADSYIVSITDSSGLTIKTETVSSTVNELDFPIQAGKTYTCSVKAKNSCGESAPNSTAQSCQQ